METVISSVFFLFSKAGKLKICNQNYEKKTREYCHSSQRNYLEDWYFTELAIKNEEDEYSRSEFHYPEYLEMSNVETESGIGESQEAIDDFKKKQKSANKNKKMATDLNNLLH